MPDPDVGAPPVPRFVRLGFPNRSTPSFAAEMIAEPSIEASKRDGMAEVALPSPRPWDTEVVPVAVGPCKAARMGLFGWRLET
jgi:hypothetical protein